MTCMSPEQEGVQDSINCHAKFGILRVICIGDEELTGDISELMKDSRSEAVVDFFRKTVTSPWTAECQIVRCEQTKIKDAILALIEEHNCCFVVTIGGVSPAPTEVTPEATQAVCDRLFPGFGEQIRSHCIHQFPSAVLSRQTAGVRGTSMIINLPDDLELIPTALSAVFQAAVCCIRHLGGHRIQMSCTCR